MLHKSFKSAKCKTALKLVVSRIKLLKNRRDAQIKQLKRELAQLLESGQDRSAMIRVEHVVREEKTIAAYDLIEIYCELIVARLPIIDSQKNCPVDLKEAIASVIFASPRCADLPELMDIRKHFTAKYGKEFISAAVELRPDCGASRLLVEKLSAKAPDGPTKVKILSAIAEEHNIKWDPKSFGEKESKPPEDLLNGPNTFEKASIMHVDPPNFQDKGPPNVPAGPNVHVPPKSYEKHDVPANFYARDGRSSSHYQNVASADISVNKAMSSDAYHPDVRRSEEMEFRHSYSVDGNTSLGRQNWNMEFKDATSAAQAAAESAERASMAARAAAELSSQEKIIRQYSTESQKSSPYGLRNESLQKYGGSMTQSEHLGREPVNHPHVGSNSRMQYEDIDSSGLNNLTGEAEKFLRDSVMNNDEPLVDNFQMAGRYSRKNSSEMTQSDLFGEVGVDITKQSSESEVELQSKNLDYVEEVGIRKQSSRASSRSHSSTFSDDHNVISDAKLQKLENGSSGNLFAVDDKEKLQSSTKERDSYDNAAVVFDDSGSDDVEFNFDNERKGQEYSLDLSSTGRRSPAHQFKNKNAWSFRQNLDKPQGKYNSQSHIFMDPHSASVFSDGSTSLAVPSRVDDLLPMTFDDSDGLGSESEEELTKSKVIGSMDPKIHRTSDMTQGESHRPRESSFAEKGNSGSSKPWLQSSSVVSKTVEVYPDGRQGIGFSTESTGRFDFGEVTSSGLSPRFSKSQLGSNDVDHDTFYNTVNEGEQQKSSRPSRFSVVQEAKDNAFTSKSEDTLEDSQVLKESSLESGGTELNLGILTGGLRNKGYRRPPHSRRSSGNNSSSKREEAEDSSVKIEQSSSSPTVKSSITSGTHSQEPYNEKVIAEANKKSSTRTPVSYIASSDDDSEGELPTQTFSSIQEQYNRRTGIEENKRLSSRVRVPYFCSSSSESDDEFPKKTSTINAHPYSGISRRTKVSLKSSEKSYSKNTVLQVPSVTLDSGVEKDSLSRSSYYTETRPKPQSQNKSSDHWGSSQRRRMADQATSKRVSESKMPSREGSFKSSAEQPSNSRLKTVTSFSTESPKASSSTVETPSREKASHVHPKLPDIDAITAHLQALRSNRL